jgi:hypothetical protein
VNQLLLKKWGGVDREDEIASVIEEVPVMETFEQDPQVVGDTAIAEIERKVDTIAAENESAFVEIPASLGSTEEEVLEAEGETGLVAKLRGIGEQVTGVANDAKTKIGELVSRVGGNAARVIDTVATAAFIATAGSIPHTEAPEAPTSNETMVQTINKSKVDAKNPEYLQKEQKRKEWHAAHGGQRSLDILKSYYGEQSEKSSGIKTHVSPEEVETALNNIDEMVKGYPEELRKDIFDDSAFTDALSILNSWRGMEIETKNQGERDQIAENIGAAIQISHRAVKAMHGDMLHGVKEKLRSGDTHALTQMAKFYDTHIENAALLSEGDNDPKYARTVLAIADETLNGLSDLLEEDSHGKDPSLTRGKTRLLEFLARAGEQRGIELLTQKIRSGEISVDDLKTVFVNTEMGPTASVSSFNESEEGDPRYARIGKGGEFLSTSLLNSYGLDAKGYVNYWKKANTSIFFNSMEHNTKALVHLEKRIPGAMKQLTESAGIRHPGRYPIELLEEQLKVNKDAKLKYGATISAIEDDNGAFVEPVEIGNLYKQAKEQGLALRVAEAGSRFEVAKRLDDMVTQNGRKMSFLGVRGHGSKDGTAMSAASDGVIDETFLGVPSDPENPDRSSLVLEDGAPIYFASCSTGAPEGFAQDLSKNTPSRKITGPDAPTYIEKLALADGPDGKLSFNIKYAGVQTKTYYQGKEVKSALPPEASHPKVSR